MATEYRGSGTEKGEGFLHVVEACLLGVTGEIQIWRICFFRPVPLLRSDARARELVGRTRRNNMRGEGTRVPASGKSSTVQVMFRKSNDAR